MVGIESAAVSDDGNSLSARDGSQRRRTGREPVDVGVHRHKCAEAGFVSYEDDVAPACHVCFHIHNCSIGDCIDRKSTICWIRSEIPVRTDVIAVDFPRFIDITMSQEWLDVAPAFRREDVASPRIVGPVAIAITVRAAGRVRRVSRPSKVIGVYFFEYTTTNFGRKLGSST